MRKTRKPVGGTDDGERARRENAKMKQFRTATRDDLPLILDMAAEFNAYFEPLDPNTPALDRARMTASLLRLCFGETPHCTVLIGEDGGAAKGYAIYNYSFWTDSLDAVLFLSALFIRASGRGAGWGKAFMDQLTQIAQTNGCGRVMWNVWDQNGAAIAFYEALGAGQIRDEPLMYLDVQT
jgi:GNAT superfamily N-acetyltransferase